MILISYISPLLSDKLRLKLIEKFLYLESIQKQISEEIYEQLLSIIKDLCTLKNEVCYKTIMNYEL